MLEQLQTTIQIGMLIFRSHGAQPASRHPWRQGISNAAATAYPAAYSTAYQHAAYHHRGYTGLLLRFLQSMHTNAEQGIDFPTLPCSAATHAGLMLADAEGPPNRLRAEGLTE